MPIPTKVIAVKKAQNIESQPKSGLLDSYPQWADDYLKNNNFQIKTKPDYLRDVEVIPDITINNTKQLHEYILEEIMFWDKYGNIIENNQPAKAGGFNRWGLKVPPKDTTA